MNLERAEAASERLMLIARDFLVAKEQHLMLNECGAHFVERVLAEISKVNSGNFCAQSPGDRIHRYMLPTTHRNFPTANIQDSLQTHHS